MNWTQRRENQMPQKAVPCYHFLTAQIESEVQKDEAQRLGSLSFDG